MLFRPWTKVIVAKRSFTVGKPSLYGKLNCKLLYYRANCIVTNCYSQSNYLNSLGKRWKKNVSTIINYTDLEKFSWTTQPKNDVVKVGVIANLSPWKNAKGLIYAIKELIDKGHNNLEIHWYGNQRGNINGYCQDYIDISKLVTQNDIQDVFSLHPATKNVPEVMSEMTALCLPSLHEEFSNSISEGICCGKPMLVSDVSDNSLMVHEGENGFLFDPNKTDSIVSAFEKFLALDRTQIEEMGKRSREIAEKLFDKNVFIESYVNLIEKK